MPDLNHVTVPPLGTVVKLLLTFLPVTFVPDSLPTRFVSNGGMGAAESDEISM